MKRPGLDPGTVIDEPRSGIKVTDAETWGRVEKGELTGFSVAGLAKRTPVAFKITSEEEAMAEQVEKRLSPEAAEPTGADVAED